MQSFPDGTLIMFNHELRYLNAGGLAPAALGLSGQMLVGRTIFEVYAPETTEILAPLYRSALAGSDSDLDIALRGRIYRQRLTPVRDDRGEIIAATGFVQDVTETRRHERDLHQSEELFRLSFTHAPFAMALISLDGRYERVNPAMCRLTGYTEAQLARLTMADITHPDDVAGHLAAIAALVAGERDHVVLEKRFVTSAGQSIWASKSATLMRREDGSPLYIIAQVEDISARRENERILVEEHRRLQRAESIGRLGSWELDVDTQLVTWSRGLYELVGVDPKPFAGRMEALLDYLHDDDVDAVRATFASWARTGGPQRFRCRIKRATDGAWRWMDARGETVHEYGRVVQIRGVVADVTEQVEAEQAAASARSFQQAVMTAAPDFTYVWDIESGSTVWRNRSLVHELGYTDEQVEEMAGDANGRLVPADARAVYDAAQVAIRDAVTDDVAQLDLPLLHADGSRRWYDRRIAPLHRDKDGKVTRFVGVLRDMTVPMAVQDALRESESKFRQLADNVDIAFTLRTWEPDEFLYLSPGFEKIFGYDPLTPAESPTRTLRHLHDEDRAAFMTDYWDVCRAGQPVRHEYRIVRPDGEIRWIRATSTPVATRAGEPRRSAAILADITDSRQAEAALVAAQQAEGASAAKNEFLGRMSHELRTPMNAILGFAQLLELDAAPGPQQEAVEHILDGGRHLVSLIDDVLDIASIEGDRLELTFEPVSVSALILETTALMWPLAAAAQVELVYQPDLDAGHRVRGDARRLRQVMLNLLSNAIKYNHPLGRVEIRCELAPRGAGQPGHLDIVVSDTGLGIRAEDLPRLFTPFDRLGAQARGIDGTGVGLALSHRLISMMGGDLRATSEFGVGSSFIASLALEPTVSSPTAAGPTSAAPDPSTPTKAPSRPMTLLYIEDVSSNVDFMRSLIRRRPRWQMVVAGYGQLGQELASAAEPDLVLLDIDLPDVSGIDVLHNLRADPGTSDLRIVIVSADANPHQIERATEAGADGYLTKPLSVADILALLDTSEATATVLDPARTTPIRD